MKSLVRLLLALMVLLSTRAVAAGELLACDSFELEGQDSGALLAPFRAKLTALLEQEGLRGQSAGTGELVIHVAAPPPTLVDKGGDRWALRTCFDATVARRGGAAPASPRIGQCSETEHVDVSGKSKLEARGGRFDDEAAGAFAKAIATRVHALTAQLVAGVLVMRGPQGTAVLFDGKPAATVSVDGGTFYASKCLASGTTVLASPIRDGLKGAERSLVALSPAATIDLFAAANDASVPTDGGPELGPKLSPHADPRLEPQLNVPLLIGAAAGIAVFLVLAWLSRKSTTEWDSVLIYLVVLGFSLCAAIICVVGLHATGLVKSAAVELSGGAAITVALMWMGLRFVRSGKTKGPDVPVVPVAPAPQVPAPAARLAVIVTVLDDMKHGVAHGQVRLSDGAVQPLNEQGQAHFHDVLQDGKRTVTATVPGWEPASVEVDPMPGAVTVPLAKRLAVRKAPTEPFTLTLRTRDPEGKPVGSGHVRLILDTYQPEASVQADGTAAVPKVPSEYWNQQVSFIFTDKKWRARAEKVRINDVLVRIDLELLSKPAPAKPKDAPVVATSQAPAADIEDDRG